MRKLIYVIAVLFVVVGSAAPAQADTSQYQIGCPELRCRVDASPVGAGPS